jgi:hypothetical protein
MIWVGCTSNRCAISLMVVSPRIAAAANFDFNAGQ